MHSVSAVSTLYLYLMSLPRVLKAVHSSRLATRASPFPADTMRSPACPVPRNITITRPLSAIMGCESLLPAWALMRNAGDSDTTPKTPSSSSFSHLVISACPPFFTASPGSAWQSASYLSARSAYCAAVDVACSVLALTSTSVAADSSSSPPPDLNAVQAPPALPYMVVPSSLNVSSHTQKVSCSVAL